jgi:alpha-glucosidase
MSSSILYQVFFIALLAPVALAQPGVAAVSSPDGRLAATFRTEGKLTYSVSFEGRELVAPSALRLDLKDQPPLGTGVKLVNTAASKTDETYRLLHGKTSSARNNYNAVRLDLEETAAPGRKLVIEARAYNDAVAFRYVVPAQPALAEFQLTKEATEFRISKDPITYAMVLPHYRSMYESEFLKLSASSFSNQGGVRSSALIGLPLLMEVPGVAWMAITEADVRGYASMYLENPSGSWTGHWFESRLAPRIDEPSMAVRGALPHASPWRVLLVGNEPGRLVESTAITSLNPEQAVKDTSWIRPGKASWDWWSGSQGPDGKAAYKTETLKYYVDFAAKSGMEYTLVDAGWTSPNDITKMNGRVDIPELVRYAAAKNVKIWIWLPYRGVAKQMDEAFPIYEKWGVAGMKIDFVERDDQEGIEFYYRFAEAAARHHLMVDFHGSTKPTGIERTYPNVLGYEAVLGMEQSKAGSRDNPDHHVMLPFTRMLVGQMDYTPGGFDNATQAEFAARMFDPMVMGTRAHTLAMYAVYDAPIQMVSDHPSAYADQPAFEFIRNVPAAWDESKVLNGRPGEFITMARRRGSEWFLGSMTNWNAREVEIPLTFLGSGSYTAETYADAEDADRLPKNVSIQKMTVTRSTVLKVKLAPGGGYAARFIASKP